jgi:hypothetical protein
MPNYQSYTNDSDTQFADQLDSYKLGTSRSGGSDYDEAVGAFNTLPESMAVGQIMQMRQAAQNNSLATRRLVAEDNVKTTEANEFAAFNDSYQNLNLDPTDYEGNAKALAKFEMQNPGNKLIKDAADGIREASGKVLTGRKQKNDSLDMDDDDATREIRQKTNLLNVQANLKKAQVLYETATMAEDEINPGSVMSKVTGTLAEKHPELMGIAASWNSRYGNNPELAEETRGMARLLTGLGTAGYLEDANKYPMENIGKGLKSLVSNINFDYNQTPEAIANAYAEAANKFEDSTPQDIALEKLIAQHKIIYNAQATRKGLEQSITDLLSKQPDIMDAKAKADFKAEIANIQTRAGVITGQVEKDYKDRKAQEDAITQEQTERKLVVQEEGLDIRRDSADSIIENKDKNTDIKEREFRRKTQERDDNESDEVFADLMRNKDFMKKPVEEQTRIFREQLRLKSQGRQQWKSIN